MKEPCYYCDVIHAQLVSDIEESQFGKVVRKCSICGTLWGASKTDKVPFVVEEDSRVQPPDRGRQAFVNDPRRTRPR